MTQRDPKRRPAAASSRRPSTSTSRTSGSARSSSSRPAAAKKPQASAGRKQPAKASQTGSSRPRTAQDRRRPAAKPAARQTGSRRRSEAPRRYRRTVRLPIGRTSVRIRVFMLVVAVLLGVAGVRAVQLQGIDAKAYAAEAGISTRFSWLYSPGATKRHSCEKITGEATSTPQTKASFR